MNKLFCVVVVCCALSMSLSEFEHANWTESFNNRLKKLQEDPDITGNGRNFTIHVVYYNITDYLNNSTFDDNFLYNNQSIYQNCRITNVSTQCSKVNIFEVVNVIPVTTEYLEVTNSPVQILRESILSNFTSLLHLKLTNNSIQYITSKLFVGLQKLRILNLSDNNILALIKTTFKGCPNLVSLDLSRNRVKNFKFIPAALAPLRNLTTLSFAGNNLRRINQNELASLKDLPLKVLDFSYCSITIVERGSFSHLSNLEKLILKVTYLNQEALANATFDLPSIKEIDLKLLPLITTFPTQAVFHLANSSIEYIDFSLTELPLIPSKAFPLLPNLKKLKFIGSLIKEIENGAFDGLSSLESLDLASNRLSMIPPSISVLNNLSFLRLSKQDTNKFYIPENSLSNLTSLIALRLELNPTQSQIVLRGLNKLVYLILFNCNIVVIKTKAFESLISLEWLDLSYNQIFSLSNDSLYGLSNLKFLNLKGNGLFIGANSQPFLHTKSLEELYLQENNLKFLRPGVFSGLAQLKELNMSANEIVPWNSSIFEGTTLVNLVARDNDIRHVTPAMLEDFKSIHHADISSNPFNCRHCLTEEFVTWMLSNGTYLQEDVMYSCSSPPDLYGHSMFESKLHLDHCYPLPLALEIRMAIGFSVVAACIVILTAFGYYFRWYFRYWWFHIHASVKRLSTGAEESAYSYDAFVSYNSADILWVTQKLIPNLENHNSQIRLCLHDRDFEVGRLITENILESIDKSKKVLLILTNSFAKSEWCLFELHVAQHRLFHDTRDALVLLQVEPLQKDDISKHLRYLMKTRTLLVWPDNPEKQNAFWVNLHKILSS